MDRQNTGVTYRRRIFFIEKRFQTKFILKFCALVVASGIFTMALLYFLTSQSSTVNIVDSRVVVKTTASFLLPLLIQTVLAVTVIISFATVFVTLFVSHKLAGPMYRFKKVMENMAEGDFSVNDFKLRKYDQLQELAQAFGVMIKTTRDKLGELEGDIRLVRKNLDDIDEKGTADINRSKLGELKKTYSKLEKTIRYFKL